MPDLSQQPLVAIVGAMAASPMGARQVIEWAAAYVDNETALPECDSSRMTDAEKAGVAVLVALQASVFITQAP